MIRDRIDDGDFLTAQDVLKALNAAYGDPHKAIKAEAELLRLGQTLHGSFFSFYSEFVRIVRPLKYENDKLRDQMVSRLNDKYLAAAGAYLELPYPQLVEKLHNIDKQFESQRVAREGRKLLTTNTAIINKPNDKDNSRVPYAAPPTTSLSDRLPPRTRAELDSLFQAGLCKKCCKQVHTKPGEKCNEKFWAPMPPNVRSTAQKESKQVNNIDANSEDPKN
jgi:hypothetical protein